MCPTFPGCGVQWDETEKNPLKINGEKEGWCPGAGSLFPEQSIPLAPPVGQKHSTRSQRFPTGVSHHTEPASVATTYPIVVAEWARNNRELIRVALDKYQGRDVLDARVWWRDEQGKWRPSRSGLTLSVKHLPSLAGGLQAALLRARALGLIE